MRIAATADLHFSAQTYTNIQEQFVRVRDEADLLLIAGDLTNYGQPSEMEMLLNALVRLRIPTVAVLGNHDYEGGQEAELQRMMAAAGIKVLDAPEIFPFHGTSRLAEVVDRHGADLVLHGHAHRGTLDRKTTAGIPVHNVAITLLQQQKPPGVYRLFEV